KADMLNNPQLSHDLPRNAPTIGFAAPELYQSFVRFARRQWPIIAAVAAIAVALSALYILVAPPSYTAQATIIIDTHRVNVLQSQSSIGDLPIDTATVESQVEILRSENIALAVIKQLRLTEDPEFVRSGGGLLGSVLDVIADLTGNAPKSDFE